MSVLDLSVNQKSARADGVNEEKPIRFIIKDSITCELIMESRRTLLKYLKINRVCHS